MSASSSPSNPPKVRFRYVDEMGEPDKFKKDLLSSHVSDEVWKWDDEADI